MKGSTRIALAGVDAQHQMYGLLFSLSNRMQAIGDQAFEDITMKQHFLMVVLHMLGGEAPTLTETAQLVGCSYQNVKRMADQLQRRGYLLIQPDAQDRRKQRLVATDKFEQLGARTQAQGEAFMRQLFQGISEMQLQNAVETLTKMDHNLGGTYE